MKRTWAWRVDTTFSRSQEHTPTVKNAWSIFVYSMRSRARRLRVDNIHFTSVQMKLHLEEC